MDDSGRGEKKWKESLTSDDTIGKYKVERLLAFGGFGCVRLCTSPEKTKVAVKTFILGRMRKRDESNMLREVEVLRRADHPNIIKMSEMVEDGQCVHLVIEYARGGDLFAQIKRHGAVGEPEASRIFMQIILAIEYLHFSLKVCHRDIKLENLLFTDLRTRNIKLIDFNLSSTFKGSKCMVNTARGTPAYSAPEVIRCMESAGLSEDTPLVLEMETPSREPSSLSPPPPSRPTDTTSNTNGISSNNGRTTAPT
eukprot:CAMPEP_0184493744 /NCGR_PEP_ID=MMETSP0113_2-20130426/26829_1 /TAXON_ID=91329 /ORGANISM="Norrisiella sphaerica, Strain BC52" /LENGTH=252 /DNA_ID=CAMNT_0026879135 /DNA_START=194 /DNA_END=949 /DNA_ORIENTATION=+